jgi:hypothetical protein
MEGNDHSGDGFTRVCDVAEMLLVEFDYGDFLRAEFIINPERSWSQCTNATKELLIVYGPKHEKDRSIFDVSPYFLLPGFTTPRKWDCNGFFVPADRSAVQRFSTRAGPLAIKYWDFRRFTVSMVSTGGYRCLYNNGAFPPAGINWPIPNLPYSALNRLYQRSLLVRQQ